MLADLRVRPCDARRIRACRASSPGADSRAHSNVHVHALVLDGVYVEDRGILRFHEAMPPTDDEIDRLLGTIDRRVHRLLARRGALDGLEEGSAADPWRDEAPVLAGIATASVQGRRALGERAGAAVRPPIAADRLHLTADGQVVLDLRHRWADGTTQLLFEPVELLERLAALTPRPRIPRGPRRAFPSALGWESPAV